MVSRNGGRTRGRRDYGIVNGNGSPEKAEQVRVSQQFREVSRMHFGGRDRKKHIFALFKTITLVIEKEKSTVGSFVELGNPDRAADVKAEVIFAIQIARQFVRIVDVAVGIQRRIAQQVIRFTVVTIAARLESKVHHAAR